VLSAVAAAEESQAAAARGEEEGRYGSRLEDGEGEDRDHQRKDLQSIHWTTTLFCYRPCTLAASGTREDGRMLWRLGRRGGGRHPEAGTPTRCTVRGGLWPLRWLSYHKRRGSVRSLGLFDRPASTISYFERTAVSCNSTDSERCRPSLERAADPCVAQLKHTASLRQVNRRSACLPPGRRREEKTAPPSGPTGLRWCGRGGATGEVHPSVQPRSGLIR
jgi:hypothetical protein